MSIEQDEQASYRPSSRRHRLSTFCSVHSWMLWSRPSGSAGYLLAVDAMALVVVAMSLAAVSTTPTTLGTAGLIVLAALAQGEASRHIERARRVISGSVHINMMSVWVFAAVLTLPVGWVGVVTAINSCHVVLRSYNVSRSYPHRQVMNAAAMILAGWVARIVLDAGNVPPITNSANLAPVSLTVILLAALAFFAVDGVLIAVSLGLDHPAPAGGHRSLRDLIGSVDDNALELATICLGTITALVLIYQPLALLFVFLPLFVLHRSVLVKQLEELASHDQKTGLLNATAWHDTATRELNKASRHRSNFGVLMVDLDHFKRVNDTYGHLAGDAVLKTVAATVKTQVRDYDSVGRFGGEEFVVLLPGITGAEVVGIAERVRHAITLVEVTASVNGDPVSLTGLSASIGVAVYPDAGILLEHLLHAADTALYRAKNTGRNKVVSAFDMA